MTKMKSNNSDKESFQDCFKLIQELESISKTYGEAKPCRFDENGQATSFYSTINVENASLFLNEVLIGGKIKKIVESNNQALIADFYKTLQKIYNEIEDSRTYSSVLHDLLSQIRNSFCKALPTGNKTKIEIENNIQIIQERDNNTMSFEKRKVIIEKVIDNIVIISILLIGVVLCFLWGKTILLIYALIICLGFVAGIISQLRNSPKSKKSKML